METTDTLQIEIEYIKVPAGAFFFHTPGQAEASERNAAFWMDEAARLGFKDRGIVCRNPDAATAHALALSQLDINTTQEAYRAYAGSRNLVIQRAVFVCRAPNAMDRRSMTLYRGPKDMADAACRLLDPRLSCGWEGEIPPELSFAVAWECMLRIAAVPTPSTSLREIQECAPGCHPAFGGWGKLRHPLGFSA